MENRIIRVLVAGMYVLDDGYPNVKWMLKSMEDDQRLSVSYTQQYRASSQHFHKSSMTSCRLILQGVRLILFAVKELGKVIRSFVGTPDFDILYIPYPAVPLLFLLSIIPRRYRPCSVADCFVSMYDTVVNDREILNKHAALSRLLFMVERRALGAAGKILVDTECNSRYLQKLFGLDDNKIAVCPLATDEHHYVPNPYVIKRNFCQVLFAGTFVPLHGVNIVAQAVLLLANEPSLRFRMIGNGQDAELVQRLLDGKACNLEWEHNWLSPSQLFEEIKNADVCLGVFGTTSKASRVWPLKNYTAMRVGRTLVTQQTHCLPGFQEKSTLEPAFFIPHGDPQSLADMLLWLAKHPDERARKAEISSEYYQQYLSNAIIMDKIVMLFAAQKSCQL